MTSLYISGPITGLPQYNKPLFDSVAATLRAEGFRVVNPHDVCTRLEEHECRGPCNPSDSLLPWADYLRADLISMLRHADGLAMLPGWEASRGANLERTVALALGYRVKPWADWVAL